MTYDLLAGTRIIESSAFIAAPLAGLTLAQLGAEVIRVDAIGGGIDYRRMPRMPGGRSLYWTGLNKAKRSVAIDLRQEAGRELVAALVTAPGKDAGVLVTNIAGAWQDRARLAAARADLILCRIEGNPDGSTAVDYTVNCATGLPGMTGRSAGPVNHVLPAWDLACALYAANAVLAALMRRRATGEGSDIRIALSDVAFATLSNIGMVAEAQLLGRDRPPIGNDIYGAFGRDFPTRDGKRVMVAAISLKQWRGLVAACGIGPLVGSIEAATGLDFDREEDRFASRDLIGALVGKWVADRSLPEVKEAFDRSGVCWGQYRSLTGALAADPRVSTGNPIFEELQTEGIGRHLSAGLPVRMQDLPRAAGRPAPMLGADTDAVLAEVLGLGEGEIGRLHDAGVVAGPEKADPFHRD